MNPVLLTELIMMTLLGVDLGGTKLAIAEFTEAGDLLRKEMTLLDTRTGSAVGELIVQQIGAWLKREGSEIDAIGISVPGIYHSDTGTVWAPNISGWADYPLLKEVQHISGQIPVTINNDRTCYILGESWKGNARGSKDAIFLSVGTGIGAGILINGEPLRGAHDIAGCIGWMALNRPYKEEYIECGCFEHYASGEGIAKTARNKLESDAAYTGILRYKEPSALVAADVFSAFEKNDPIALAVMALSIECWGMAIANLISLFNPEKIILGGGVFGPARQFIPDIRKEVRRWAQPVSVHQCSIEESALGGDAGLYGAGFLALKNTSAPNIPIN
jgi:glucokinase